MNIEQLKNSIASLMKQADDLNFGLLYPSNPQTTNWQNMTTSEVKNYVDDMVFTLRGLKNNLDLLNTTEYNYVSAINTHLSNFVSQLGDIQNLQENQITTQHHGPLSQLQGLGNNLKVSSLYAQIKLVPDIEKKTKSLKEANSLANKLVKGRQSFEAAIEVAEKWKETKQTVQEKVFAEHSATFANRAQEHMTKRKEHWYGGKYWWFVLAIISGAIAGWVVYTFIEALGENNDISVGASLLRISSLLVPAYFAVFCAQQFLFHKKMCESYKFKDTALSTMSNLMKTSKEQMEEKILERGLEVIFKEPLVKEDGKYDKQLVGELLSMLRSQTKNQ